MTKKALIILSAGLIALPCTAMAQEPAPVAPVEAPAATLSQEQQAVVQTMMQEYLQTVALAKETVLTITDKETANDAAPKLKELLQQMDDICDTLEGWAVQEGICDAVDAMLVAEYKDKMGDLEELDMLLTALGNLEVPFHGANDLEDVLLDGDDEVVEVVIPAEEAVNHTVVVEEGPEPEVEAPAAEAPAATLTPEQESLAGKMKEQYAGFMEKIHGILLSAKDKETADAAAAQLKEVMGEFADTIQSFAQEVEKMECTPRQRTLMELHVLPVILPMKDEVDAVINNLSKQEPAFFGSADLQTVLKGAN